ncbi:hypothetical protein [Acuticoccus sediminis]|uniref:hypothetical protein n=1 Tax=Acuticoccus sediminis TaxID=2184697 RepID=UPI001CFF31BB|nr:hypothetical protein [Acuticoccus sediminis]
MTQSRTTTFSFDPADVEPDDLERERFKDKNRRAFERADYVPPELRTAPEPRAPRASPAPSPAPKPAAPKVPSFRRQRGRPAGERQHRVSFKSTEPHLAALYAIAGQGELVGVFEHAVELLAREVADSERYAGRPVDREAMEAVHQLLRYVEGG